MKVLLCTGGSGGHIFPALSVAKEFRRGGHEVVFVATPGMAEEKIKKNDFEVLLLNIKGLSLSPVKSFLLSIFYMIEALMRSFGILRKLKPDVVVGFGGYGAFPVVFVASLLRYPTLIHEQNVRPGRANLLLSKFVKKIAISFQESQKYFMPRKTVLTGCPLYLGKPTMPKEKILEKFLLTPGKWTILVVGGSQGSHRINEEFLKTTELLKRNLSFQVIHLTGERDYAQVQERYRQLGIDHCVFSFLDDIHEAYAVADLVISRAGAVTIAELMMFGVSAILIPYPHAFEHQKENAKVLQGIRLARIIEEPEMSSERLKKEIEAALSQLTAKEGNPVKQNFYITDAPHRIVQEVLSLTQ